MKKKLIVKVKPKRGIDPKTPWIVGWDKRIDPRKIPDNEPKKYELLEQYTRKCVDLLRHSFSSMDNFKVTSMDDKMGKIQFKFRPEMTDYVSEWNSISVILSTRAMHRIRGLFLQIDSLMQIEGFFVLSLSIAREIDVGCNY